MSVALDLARRRAPAPVPVAATSAGEGFRTEYLQALRLVERLHRLLLEEGIVVSIALLGSLSTPMGDAEVDAFVSGLGRAVRRLHAGLGAPAHAGRRADANPLLDFGDEAQDRHDGPTITCRGATVKGRPLRDPGACARAGGVLDEGAALTPVGLDPEGASQAGAGSSRLDGPSRIRSVRAASTSSRPCRPRRWTTRRS